MTYTDRDDAAEKVQVLISIGIPDVLVVEDRNFYMGGPAMLGRLSVAPASTMREAAERAAARGQASVSQSSSTGSLWHSVAAIRFR
jgi:hypothetical protein